MYILSNLSIAIIRKVDSFDNIWYDFVKFLFIFFERRV